MGDCTAAGSRCSMDKKPRLTNFFGLSFLTAGSLFTITADPSRDYDAFTMPCLQYTITPWKPPW
eukprot:309677-Pleurochrysis_carterae.AAC.1